MVAIDGPSSLSRLNNKKISKKGKKEKQTKKNQASRRSVTWSWLMETVIGRVENTLRWWTCFDEVVMVVTRQGDGSRHHRRCQVVSTYGPNNE